MHLRAPSVRPPQRSRIPPPHPLEGPAHPTDTVSLMFLDLRHLVAPGRVLGGPTQGRRGQSWRWHGLSSTLPYPARSEWLLVLSLAGHTLGFIPRSLRLGMLSPIIPQAVSGTGELAEGCPSTTCNHTSPTTLAARALVDITCPSHPHRRKRQRPCSNIPL